MKNTTTRNCPVCTAPEKRLLFRQNFGAFSQGSLLTGFNLVVCANCGTAYADDIPRQEAFDCYYAEMSKYEVLENVEESAEIDLHCFGELVDQIGPYFNAGSRLLDIGCATGGLLAAFKKRGFLNLLGVDPSPACARLTEQLYGIPAKALTISTLHQLEETFDAVFLTGVLEHLRDVDSSINNIKGRLRQGKFYLFRSPRCNQL